MPTITVAGETTFYRRHPSRPDVAGEPRPPLVLIHGAGGTLTHWPPRLRRLPGQTVIAPDLPGHGQSAGRGATRIADYGDWLTGFLDALEIERAALAGHSMGGAIALDVAHRYPARVSALIVLGAGATLTVASALLTALQADFVTATAKLARLTYRNDVTAAEITTYAAHLRAVNPALLMDDLHACDRFDMRGQVGAIDIPTLIIVGAEDRMTPPALSRSLHQEMPNSSLAVIDGAGHMVMLEREDAVMAAFHRFLASETHG